MSDHDHNVVQALSGAVETLGTNVGLQTFLDNLSTKFIEGVNTVLLYNPKKQPKDLKIEIADKWEKLEDEFVCTLFKQAWNSVGRTGHPLIHGACTMEEWSWILPHLVKACRRATHSVVRMQFAPDEDSDEDVKYEYDEEDLAKAYYCVGVVWRTLFNFFDKKESIIASIKTLFIKDKKVASAAGLPTGEVDRKIFSNLLYANRVTLEHFEMMRDRYHVVTHKRGYPYVSDAMVLRHIRQEITVDEKFFESFKQLTSFPPHDVDKIWSKYNERFETLVGIEVANQLQEDLKRSKTGTLEQLRHVKDQSRKRKRSAL